VDGIDLVIHADPPAEHKAYVHRSGRTARGGADGVVVTIQTAAQAREVTSLMRKAGVTPRLTAADPGSEVLHEIAGPPAPRVTLLKPVTELVKPAERRSDRPGPGKPGTGKRRAGRPDRRKPRPAGGDRPARDERPARFERDERTAGDQRGPNDRRGRDDQRGRPGESGVRRGGATVRSGYPGSRSAAGKRRDSGQGRHF
jgi:superfamily II DNA/RNA helicase